MKLVTKQQLKDFRNPLSVLPKLDYNMLTKYYRVVDNPNRVLRKVGPKPAEGSKRKQAWEPDPTHKTCQNVGASVDPRVAAKILSSHHKADLWEVTL